MKLVRGLTEMYVRQLRFVGGQRERERRGSKRDGMEKEWGWVAEFCVREGVGGGSLKEHAILPEETKCAQCM